MAAELDAKRAIDQGTRARRGAVAGPSLDPAMSLPHAILTALLEKPSSGLELARRFDKSIGYFWSATHQQIYRELAKLEERAGPGPAATQPGPRQGVQGAARRPEGIEPVDAESKSRVRSARN